MRYILADCYFAAVLAVEFVTDSVELAYSTANLNWMVAVFAVVAEQVLYSKNLNSAVEFASENYSTVWWLNWKVEFAAGLTCCCYSNLTADFESVNCSMVL